MSKEPLNLAALRAQLAGRRGKEYWRSLEELAETADFQDLLRHEFPQGADIWEASLSRRGFLKVMGASLAMAGLTGCSLTSPQEKIVPYVNKPDAVVPGLPLFFATAMPLSGYAMGLLVRSNEGRPTKVEGNPDHPASLGATDVYAQASILSLYDPDRSQAVLKDGQPSTWGDFVGALNGVLTTQRGKGGAGLRILTETVTSPTLIGQMQALLQQFPQARWYQYEPGSGDGARAGAQLAFGQPVNTIYNFDQANLVVSLDSDFMLKAPGRVRYSRGFMAGRLVRDGRKEMNRLYVVESTPTITGAQADHRLPLKAGQIEAFARALAQALGINAGGGAAPAGVPADWLPALVKDLQANRGRSIVIAGEEQPAAVHALAHAINNTLGNTGTTVSYTEPAEANPGDQLAGLRELAGDMAGGRVELLLMLGGNPAYTAPADLGFIEALSKVGLRVHLGTHADETAALSNWHIPEAHYLESWGDARAYDGTVSIIQPLIAPLWGGRTAHDLVAALLGQNTSAYDAVRAYWQGQRGGGGDAFETFWRTTLNKGVVEGTALPAASVTLNSAAIATPAAAPAEGLELTFRLDPSLWDGRFANNGWLQELPKPLTTLTWDNVAMVSPKLAEQQGLQNGDVIQLSYQGRSVSAPVWIMPGQPDDSVAVTLGYGRNRAGNVGNGAGFNAYTLRTADAPGFGAGLAISKVGSGYELANTQKHYTLEGRDLIRHATLEEYLHNPNFAHESAEGNHDAAEAAEGGELVPGHKEPSLYPEYPYNGNKWGMVIDTQACIGCNACVIACQSENNIAVVGKDQVSRSREMHWLKIDTYFEGGLENPETMFQPRLCMQCEQAPCEVVCPVHATVHDHEGLNAMIYNRCVGTRYCSNNCPYKVRRYNFLQYSKNDIPVIQLSYNPDVTVRNRGVMEKCTYCVQRISAARIASDRENRPIADGEVVTACQQVCPTNAIVFGNINDANSQVAKLKAQELNYGILEDLNTRPRTSYMPRVRNPNPEIKEVRDGV
ncbi:MAG TPA: TAT-variant-translocated molybdopterin oxidoreductase [Roseiflexaceae bacterium]|nr:TAT-variant-translocated molybdopterin oxidoreductase [Roseiflexaceae bacterium]